MQCPYCHAEDQEGRFCKICGKPLNEEASDLTRVMPPLDALHEKPATAADTEETAPPPDTSAANDTSENPETSTDDAPASDGSDEVQDEASTDPDIAGEETEKPTEDAEDTTLPPLPAFLTEDEEGAYDSDENAAKEEKMAALRKRALTICALVIGIALAAIAAFYLFTDIFDTTPQADPNEQVKNADIVAPDTSLAEDTIVGHWRHYNTGSVIEKIGTSRYRWTIGDEVYQLDFKDNLYVYKDENGNVYNFALTNADRLQLTSSNDKSGGLITDPVFESGYTCGRVGQDGTMAQSMRVNPDAFNIVGKTYAELAGTFGPGSLSVIGDNQYIIFRAQGGNFAVQFEGETVPLQADGDQDYQVTPLHSQSANYSVVPLSYDTTTPPSTTTPGDDSGGTTNPPSGNTTPGDNTGNSNTQTPPSTSTSDDDEDKDTEYTVEIPDMPTFPSTTAVATGVVWADLGFVIENAPDTLSVNDLSAVLGIALEVGTAPANESGFNFFGMDEGYFAGTYAYGDHSFYISGYGSSALEPDKTILFIQQIS